MVWVGDESSESSIGSFSAHIQQAQPEVVEHLGEAMGKVFLVWCPKGTDVDVGDTLTIASGDYSGTYSVKYSQLNATGNNQHLELTIIRDTT